MADLRTRTASRTSRSLCAATLLFVFFLPLHFHFSLSPQLSSQCSCVHGVRTQLAVHDAAPFVAPPAQFAIVLEARAVVWSFTALQRPFVRGPPASLPV